MLNFHLEEQKRKLGQKMHILVRDHSSKYFEPKAVHFFVKLQHEISTMFLLFLAAHQSSTRIARINNEINHF